VSGRSRGSWRGESMNTWPDSNNNLVHRYLQTHSTLLANVIRKAGLKPPTGRIGPRVHDLRHAFVVNRMLSWYREGIIPQSRLPYLATYLGHKDVHGRFSFTLHGVFQRESNQLRAPSSCFHSADFSGLARIVIERGFEGQSFLLTTLSGGLSTRSYIRPENRGKSRLKGSRATSITLNARDACFPNAHLPAQRGIIL
jgi:hypothetical protein